MQAFHCKNYHRPAGPISDICHVAKAFVYTFLWSYIRLIVNPRLLLYRTLLLSICISHFISTTTRMGSGIIGRYNDRRSAMALICMYSALCRCCVLDASLPGHILRIVETSWKIFRFSQALSIATILQLYMQPRIEGNKWTNNRVYKKHMLNQSHTHCCAELHCNPLYENSSNATGPENKSLKILIFVSRSQCRSRKLLIRSRIALIRTRYIPGTIRDDALTPTLNFWISLIVTPGPLPE